MADYYLKPFQERALSVFMDKFGADAGIEVIASFEKTGSLGKAMIAYCHSLPKYIIRRNVSEFSFLVLTEDNKYEWGCKKDAALFTNEQSKEIQKILAFRTSIEEYNQSLHQTPEADVV